MGISRMLKMQLLGHLSVKEELKKYLREAGVVEVTDVSIEQKEIKFDEESVLETEKLLEKTEAAVQFLDGYVEKLSFFERLGRGRLLTSPEEVERLSGELPLEEIWGRCDDLQNKIRAYSDELARSRELVRALEPWAGVAVALESIATEGYEMQFWTLPEKAADEELSLLKERFPLVEFEERARERSKSFLAVILPGTESEPLGEALGEMGAFHSTFANLEGTPADVMEKEKRRWKELAEEIEKAQSSARELAVVRNKLLMLADHFGERIGLGQVERYLFSTDHTFLLEGWVNAAGRRRLQEHLTKRFDDIELSFRPPTGDENPPIDLENRPAIRPFEFVTTLYGRPIYREVDPTPLLAPFFILFFALCLSDAGYGLTLSAVSAVLLIKFKPSGGAGKMLQLLFMGGIVTALVGLVTGGVFGIEAESFPAFLQRFVFINPLDEPMKMLNIAFLMGLVHLLFGIGLRMASNFRAGFVGDALFDDLLWILFLAALTPLGYSVILGGEISPELSFWSKRVSLGIAACIFLTGGRKQKGIVKKFFKGLIGFYDIVGYFGDVLSYARLLALGLATSAIAFAVNGIAGMVRGLPFYTGYIAAALILVLGHGFNMAVNTLGAFVHSGRLQYLEFFSKFFTGGGSEFRPFKSDRRYSVMKEKNIRS